MSTNRPRVLSTAVLLAVMAWPRPASPCSSLVLMAKGRPVFGTNYDNPFAPGQIFINRRGVRKSGWEAGTTGRVARWVSRYGSVTISCVGYQLAWGGMNEAGLVFSTMVLGGTRPPAADARPPLAGALWWQYLLDTCATIEELRAAAEEVRVNDTQDHYLACDRTGATAVVECLAGRLVIRSGADLPVGALANAPYQACLDHWTSRRPGPADPYASFNRFSRLAAGIAAFKSGKASKAVERAFSLLAGVAAEDTRWTFVCDIRDRVFHLKTHRNPRVRTIDLKKIDFSCTRPTAMLDAHADLAGDITGAFHDYAHDEAEAHLSTALKHFRPGLPAALVARVLALFESFSCEPVGK